jgi:hypothetical protein
MIRNITPQGRERMREGGRKTAAKLTPEQRREISRKSMAGHGRRSSGDDNVREDFESCYVAFCGAVAVDFVDHHSVDVPIRVQVLHDAD